MIGDLSWFRVGAAVPRTRVADVASNVASMVDLAGEAAQHECDLVVFPELSLTSYTCGELFQQRVLLDAVRRGLRTFAHRTSELPPAFVVGLPLEVDGRLFNVAAVVQGGRVLGLVPKSYVPGYNEYYEHRWFSVGPDAVSDAVELRQQDASATPVPFGVDLLFANSATGAVFGIELCEDLWAPVPPSSTLAMEGALIIANPSASNELVGKADYRRDLVRQQSARTMSGYVYAAAGPGESTTDLVFGGHAVVAENGRALIDSERFVRTPHVDVADIDLELLRNQRLQNLTFAQNAARHGLQCPQPRHIPFEVAERAADPVHRDINATPFVPADIARREERCREIFAIQSTALATRMEAAGLSKAILGLSGGLDSTLALLVTAEAFARLERPLEDIRAITMPGFGTTEQTLGNVQGLCDALRIPLQTIDIRDACRQHFKDLEHDETTHDVTFENTQARERTQILMDKANQLGGLVVGTGDLSELALGWCTYNADHMSMYSVNCGVPKTLVRYLVEYVADHWGRDEVREVLQNVLETPISPELLPADDQGLIAQKTEEAIGPYELHDFFLYNTVRCGFGPRKILALAEFAFGARYEREELRSWLTVFIKRFFSQQFKRSCLPDGPKVGTVGLSPRGDWRMPSDASANSWLAELD
ncbi:MAG: NAD(+) synthase [Verrucomicrobiota bacterium]